MPSDGKGLPGWLFPGLCAIALLLLTLAYSNSFENSFHFDDSHVVEDNLYVRSVKNIPRFFRDASTFSSLPANSTYRPLVTTTIALDYWIAGGLKVRQFHVTQFLLLVALGIMVLVMFLDVLTVNGAQRWHRYAALTAATLFCVHTTATETMNLIHARSELLSAMGLVGSFLVYLHLPASRRWHLYLVPMVVGALAKSPSVIFAPLLFMYVALFEQRLSIGQLFERRSWPKTRAVILKTWPDFVVGAVTFVSVESMNAAGAAYGGGSRFHYLLTQIFVWAHYGRLFFLPIGLTADTDWGLITQWYDPWVAVGLLFLIALLIVLWKSSEDQALRPAAFGVAWFALGLLPASSIFPLAEVVNEHRVFLPFIGLSLAVVVGAKVLVDRWAARRHAAGVANVALCATALIFIGGNAAGTYQRNKVWRSEETLWRDVTLKSPKNGRGLMNYGLTQMSKGSDAVAKQYFDQALVYNPNYYALEINLGIVTDRLGQPAVAEQHFARALQLQPNEPAVHYFYARWLVGKSRTAEAIPHLERAIALSPARMDARYLLMSSYASLGRDSESQALAQAILAIVPGDVQATEMLSGQAPITLPGPSGPATAQDLLNLSLARYQSQDFQGSIEAARSALRLKPDYAEAYNNIAAAYASLGKWGDAIQAAREALRLKPDFQLAKNNLAWAESENAKK